MKYAIIYSSRTGNTQQMAEALREGLPKEDCLYVTEAEQAPAPDSTPCLLFVGFWVDRGSCDAASAAYLEKLENQNIFLFGTAGFEGNPAYYASIFAAAEKHLKPSNTVAGISLCQGRLPETIQQRYQVALEADPDDKKALARLQNYEASLSHPNEADKTHLQKKAAEVLAGL